MSADPCGVFAPSHKWDWPRIFVWLLILFYCAGFWTLVYIMGRALVKAVLHAL